VLNRDFAKVGKQDLQAFNMVWPDSGLCQKVRGQFTKGHVWLVIGQLEPFQVGIFDELRFDLQSDSAIACPGGLLMPDAVLVRVAPIDATSLH
jgi:hypothetical protein